MELDNFTIGLLGTIGTSLVGVVGVLWRDNINLRKEKDALHKEVRDTMEKNLRESHSVMSNNTVAFNALREAILRNG